MKPSLTIAILVLAALAAPIVTAETYDLHIYPYCPPGSSICGFGTEEVLRTQILNTVHEVNVIWEPTGVSFRPTIMPVDSTNPDYYLNTGCASISEKKCSATTDKFCGTDADCPAFEACVCSGPDCVCEDRTTSCTHDSECAVSCSDVNWHRRVLWREQVAASNPLAISMMVTDGMRTCCSNVASDTKPANELFGIWCDAERSASDGGHIWAHELGHHFCLSHTFNYADFADTMPAEPNYDHDANVGGVFDTPPDPGKTEGEDLSPVCEMSGIPCPDGDECGMSDVCDTEIYAPHHDFCLVHALQGLTDDDSPHDTKCGGGCLRCTGGVPCGDGYLGVLQDVNVGTHWSNLMSYYGAACSGPYVVNGFRTEGISPSSQARIVWCEANVASRSLLQDVCEFEGYDLDFDGWCHNEDNCPTVRNTNQSDVDGDLLGDRCDPCPSDPLPTGDLDGDGIGDLCDQDIDGDGCRNWEDRRPYERRRRIGGVEYFGCPSSVEHFYAFEGDDGPDPDHVLDCWDVDDDDDGICDDDKPFAANPADGTAGGCSAGPDPCPHQAGPLCETVQPGPPCPPEWMICVGTGCEEFDLHIFDVVNPGIRTVITDFEIWNRTIYMVPPTPITPSELAQAIAAGSEEGTTLYNMVIVDQGGVIKAVIADGYSSADVVFSGDIRYGPYVHLTPAQDGGPMAVGMTYAIGTTGSLPDAEGDGRPDMVDNCTGMSSFLMTDADRDGFGNLCDADLDNDGVVTTADVEAVEACDGADLDVRVPISEPEFEPGFDIGGSPPAVPPDPILVGLAQTCAAADLNDDRIVDDADRLIALALVGTHPGPSGVANLVPVADAGPDLPQPCGGQVTLDGGASYDPEGAPLICNWSSADCAIADPASCTTTADCPDGIAHASLVVNDGLLNSVADDLQVVTSCTPGQVPSTMTISKNRLGGFFASLTLQWRTSCQAGDYGIYEGTVGQWYTHQQKDCSDDGGNLSEAVFPDSGDKYYLVIPLSATAEGSHGQNSAGVERTPGVSTIPCRPAKDLAACSFN